MNFFLKFVKDSQKGMKKMSNLIFMSYLCIEKLCITIR